MYVNLQNPSNYHFLPYNYGYTSQNKESHPIIHIMVRVLIRGERYLTVKKLEWKREVKEKGSRREFAKDDEINKLISDEEATEFLKLMKHNDYNIVNQLNKIQLRYSYTLLS